MIESLLKDPTFQFILAIATIIGGISASIHIGSLLMTHRKSLVTGSRNVSLWLIVFSIPMLLIISAIGMSRILGSQMLLLGGVGFTFCATAYLIPTLVKTLWQSQSQLLAVVLCALYIPLLILCALALFTAAYFVSIGSAPDFKVLEFRLWSIFTILEVLHILGIRYVYRTQSVSVIKSNPSFKRDA